MLNINSVNGDTIEARLRFLGANTIQKVQGSLYFVSFTEREEEISYSYNINTKNKYFLQRIKPYPLPEGIFSDEDQVVEFINRDLKKFRNAAQSNNFSQFVQVTNLIGATTQELENFFLNYNVDKECLLELLSKLRSIRQTIHTAKERSDHIIL